MARAFTQDAHALHAFGKAINVPFNIEMHRVLILSVHAFHCGHEVVNRNSYASKAIYDQM